MAQRFVFYAGRDFNMKNLRCKEGDQLPDRWQEPTLVRKLREDFGEAAVVVRSTTVQRKDEAKTAAQAAAEYEEKKSKKGKKDKTED